MFILFMVIMFINQQAFFTKIDKDIRFCGLVPLVNRKKGKVIQGFRCSNEILQQKRFF